jgi:hypothetical protein
MKSSDSPTRATPPQWVNTAALNIAREFYAQEYSESDHARLVSIIVSALAEASCEATPPPQGRRSRETDPECSNFGGTGVEIECRDSGIAAESRLGERRYYRAAL